MLLSTPRLLTARFNITGRQFGTYGPVQSITSRASIHQSPLLQAPTRPNIRVLRHVLQTKPRARKWHDSRPSRPTASHALSGLFGICTVIFGAWQFAIRRDDPYLTHLLLQNCTISVTNWEQGRYWTLVTAAVSHLEPLHFIFNIFALHIFCSVIAPVPGIGAAHILAVALGSGVAGNAVWLYRERRQSARGQTGVGRWVGPRRTSQALGASGMVMGMSFAAACLRPTLPMSFIFLPFVSIPLWVTTVGYAAFDLYYLDKGGRVGHAAHLGGAAFGLLYYFVSLRRLGGVWSMVFPRR